jgi:tryptophan synthase beta chain
VAKRVQAIAVPESPVEQKEEKLVRPDAEGRYGRFGGKYVPETLIPALAELEAEYAKALQDPSFQVRRPSSKLLDLDFSSLMAIVWQAELDAILKDYVGRETPLYYAERLSEHYRRYDWE